LSSAHGQTRYSAQLSTPVLRIKVAGSAGAGRNVDDRSSDTKRASLPRALPDRVATRLNPTPLDHVPVTQGNLARRKY
jgi:hypothetical protein